MATLRSLSLFILLMSLLGPKASHATDAGPARPALLNQHELPAKYREAAEQVVAALIAEQQNPREFKAVVEENDAVGYIFHLWHLSAFTPENKGALGNPGGKCRDIVYDPKSRKTSASKFWQ